ncbi:unnamed protein product [Spodoptera littoralis]|uniref:Uncharacterized protein n=1 Tax=Spodoptera littoralis TaxID=7109 RepID=A0A9P0N2E3_SPOLI|nr:unnamed protein product [Spodoptera littoralis]CAH1639936.1 unnamed protein product [Spodoptera littoralis]
MKLLPGKPITGLLSDKECLLNVGMSRRPVRFGHSINNIIITSNVRNVITFIYIHLFEEHVYCKSGFMKKYSCSFLLPFSFCANKYYLLHKVNITECKCFYISVICKL